MEKLVVTDPVPGCPIESVELTVVSTEMIFGGPDGESRTLPIRLVAPAIVDGRTDYMTYCLERIIEELMESNGDDGTAVETIVQMLALNEMDLPFDARRERQFDIASLEPSVNDHRPTPFDEIRAALGVPNLSPLSLMDKIVSPVGDDYVQLIHDAIYERPFESIPLSRPAYEELREDFLRETEEARTAIGQSVQDAVRDALKNTPRKLRKELAARLTNKALTLGATELRKILRRAHSHEVQIASRFADLVVDARRLHDAVGCHLEALGLIGLSPNETEQWLRFEGCVNQHLSVAGVNALIDRVRERLCQVYELVGGMAGQPWSEEDKEITQLEREIAAQQYLALGALRQSGDVLDKWDAVCDTLKLFVNRNECIRLLQREAELTYARFVDLAHRQIFRKIRRHLTRPERRLFLLMCCAMPKLNGRIVGLNPLLASFFWGMDNETQGLIVLVLVHKIQRWGDENLSGELDRRFRVYLRFYPYWLTLVREHERETKQTKRYEHKTVSLSTKVKLDSGDEAELIDAVADPRDTTMAAYHHLIAASPDTLRKWAVKHCRPTDASRLIRYHSDDLSQQEIADQDGVSQQMISVSIGRGYRDLIQGLLAERIIESSPGDL